MEVSINSEQNLSLCCIICLKINMEILNEEEINAEIISIYKNLIQNQVESCISSFYFFSAFPFM